MHISQFAIDHDDAEVALLVSEGVFIRDDVDVPKFLQYFELVFDILSFLFVDFDGLYFFESIVIILFCFVSAQEYIA